MYYSHLKYKKKERFESNSTSRETIIFLLHIIRDALVFSTEKALVRIIISFYSHLFEIEVTIEHYKEYKPPITFLCRYVLTRHELCPGRQFMEDAPNVGLKASLK
jgi:hypothetical protein